MLLTLHAWHAQRATKARLSQFSLSLGKETPCIFPKFNPLIRLLGCGSSVSEKVCFWCPLRYCNGEILRNFIWFCNSCWGQFGTWKIWPFVPKWGGQREGRWEFASHVFRVSFILLRYHTFFQIKTHFDLGRSLSANNMSGNVHLSWMWFTGVLALCSPA